MTAVAFGDSLDASEVLYVLFDGEALEDGVLLRTVAEKFSDFLEIFLHVEALDADGSVG